MFGKWLWLLAGILVMTGSPALADEACVPQGQWIAPGGGAADLASAARGRSVVLLGETHDSAEDHRWQLHVLAQLHALTPNMVLGFEAFPRRVQPVLDKWVAGDLDEKAFLDQSDWEAVWGYDAGFYLPLLHFARMHGIPVLALNVKRELVRKTREKGWAEIPEDEREGVEDPAPASEAYRAHLEEIFEEHKKRMGDKVKMSLDRFVEAQLLWDRAMAQALAEGRNKANADLAVGVVGRGHLEYGHGVPHQLSAMGVAGVASLMTWAADRDCADLVRDGAPIADLAFGVRPEPENKDAPARPLLGVMLDAKDGVVSIRKVIPESVAEAAGLKDGDVFVTAAGEAVSTYKELVTIIRRQASGTWLPLTVKRDGTEMDIVAKFPTRP